MDRFQRKALKVLIIGGLETLKKVVRFVCVLLEGSVGMAGIPVSCKENGVASLKKKKTA